MTYQIIFIQDTQKPIIEIVNNDTIQDAINSLIALYGKIKIIRIKII